MKAQAAFDAAIDTWSDSRLKAYLDARGGKIAHLVKTFHMKLVG
jgi:hypothetical protein